MKNAIPYIVIAVLLLLLINQCNGNKSIVRANYEALNDTVSYYQNRLGTQTATIKTLQGSNKDLEVLLLDKDAELAELAKEFKKIKSVVKVETVMVIDTIREVFKEPIPCPDFERKGEVNEKWYQFKYQFNNLGFSLDSPTFKNETTVITGVKQKWFLGKQYVTTDVTNSNPYITVTDLQAYQMEVPTPIYKKWYVWLGAGVITGIVISK